MRRLFVVVFVLVLAGCTGLAPAVESPSETATPDIPADDPASQSGTDAETESVDDADSSSDDDASTPDDDGEIEHEQRPDPDSDTIGWHDGYWHDDPIAVNATGGFNDTELDIVTARAMARVELIRNLSFEDSVNVTVINRTEFIDHQAMNQSGGGEDFEEARYRATFLVGDDESATKQEQETTEQSVGGFYSPGTGDIVIVSDSETPEVDIGVLAHELAHALQDQHFDLSALAAAPTQDKTHGQLGLIEGGAETVRFDYLDRCGEIWVCAFGDDDEDADDDVGEVDIHLGLYLTSWFPYDDGPGFIDHLRDGEDWSNVNDAYESPPTSSREILAPEEFGSFEPATVDLEDRSTDEWTRLESAAGSEYERIGQAGLTAMFAYPLYDDRSFGGIIDPQTFLKLDENDNMTRNDLVNYDLPSTNGLAGDRLHLYERNGDAAHIWRLEWDSSEDAALFVERYEELLAYWGATHTDTVWTIDDDSPFPGVYDIDISGSTVTITNAPTANALDDVHP